MAKSSYQTFLMSGTSTEDLTKLIDIKNCPALGGAPESLETTTLTDCMTTYCEGIQQLEPLEFTANHTKEDYEKLLALAGQEKTFGIYLGASGECGNLTPTGTDGIWTWKGTLSVFLAEQEVNGVREMTITIAPATPVKYDAGA